MPIYEYRCRACGFQKEYLQKMSDTPLSTCPECGEQQFDKMLTAAGFQLKGKGWYATDFKGGAAADKCPVSANAETKTDSSKGPPAACAGCACANNG